MKSVRMFYKKTGNLKFVSHLDMNRFMIRLIRMSQIPVWYSEGFNPHPYITFALPLSLGFESEYEVMDIRLDDDTYSCEDVLKNLNAVAPDEIKFIECLPVQMKAGSIASADFCIEFSEVSESIQHMLDAFLNSDVIATEKTTKKGAVKIIDIKPMILDFKFTDQKLYLRLRAGGSENLNPKFLLDAFCEKNGMELPSYSVVRTMLYNENGDCFR